MCTQLVERMNSKLFRLIDKSKIIPLILLYGLIGTITCGQNLNLKVIGDTEQGFKVAIYDGIKLLVKNR